MNFALESNTNYKSNSQRARSVTEIWVRNNLYCPHCGGTLELYPANTKSKDAFCIQCGEAYQVKSGKGNLSKKIPGGEYKTTRANMEQGETPSFILLRYSSETWTVTDIEVIHRAFITPSCLIPRKPLSPQARRAGWQGCEFDFSGVPAIGRIQIIQNGNLKLRADVLAKWRAIQPILNLKPEKRLWTAELLRIVESLPISFDLDQVYQFKSQLQQVYPDNHHIKAKIRQQLQVLRDLGKIKFLSKGKYQRQTS